MRLSLILVVLSILASVLRAQPPAIVQKTSGWCSPAIANVVGNVTVNCIGVDPRALQRLNSELKRKNLQLSEKIREADEWTRRYKELEAQLSEAGHDSILSRRAEEALHEGDLEKAGAILDQILASEEKQIDRTASNHYNRALVFELQFRLLDALPHLQKAYQYRPEQVKYGEEYGRVLIRENDFTHAEAVLLGTLENARRLAKANSATDQPGVAGTLNKLANIYRTTQRTKEAEAALREALDIYRQLAKTNPEVYQPDLAGTLNNLAILYRATQRTKEAEAALQEALDTDRKLAKTNPAVYQPDMAGTLNNLGVLYFVTERMREAEVAFEEALDSYGQLSKSRYRGADRWSSGGPAEERQEIPLSQLLVSGAGSDTRNLRCVMPNSPPNTLNLMTCQHFLSAII
jgi:tetratricopeptide (TPR) repeat protein